MCNKEIVVLSIDLGSTDLKLILFSNQRKEILCKRYPLKTYYPRENWVEQNGDEFWEIIEKNLIKLLDSLKKEDYPSFLSISTQRESVLLWAKKDSKALSPIISWQDNRTEDFTNSLKEEERNWIRQKTGLWITSYNSATKLNYLIKKIGNTLKEEYLMGTLESWLIYKLTKGTKFVSEYSCASRTALLNLQTLEWDSELCSFFEIPLEKLPTLINSNEELSGIEVGKHKLKIKGILGDQQSALYFAKKNHDVNYSLIYGTGAFLLKLMPKELEFQDLLDSFEGEYSPLITLAWKKINESPRFALEWSFSNCGQSLIWLKNLLNIPSKSSNLEDFNWISSPLCLPFFSGKWLLSSKRHWDSYFFSINNQTKVNDLIFSYFEGIAFSIRLVLEKIEINKDRESILIGGGLTKCNSFCSIQSNALKRTLIISHLIQLSGLGVILFTIKEVPAYKTKKISINSKIKELIESRYNKWNKLIEQSENF